MTHKGLMAVLVGILALVTLYAVLDARPHPRLFPGEQLPVVLWRSLWLPLMIQAFVILTTVIAILALVRERIIR